MLRCFRFALHQKDISGGKSLPRQNPAALGGGERPRGGGEAAPRGESLGDCERQVRPGASTAGCDGCLLTVWQLSLFADC